MVIQTERTLALRCPLCGRLELHQISRFDSSRKSSLIISCECGFNKMVISRKNKSAEYYLQISCLVCDDVHIIKINRNEFWKRPNLVLRCVESGQELGYLGSAEAINKLVKQKREDVDSIINNFGFDDYFTNPQVMYEIFNHLHKIAEANKLFCRCGNDQIEIDVFPEKLELHCPYCQSLHIIYAETIEDLRVVKEARMIALTEKGFSSFDSSKVHPI